MPSINLNHKNSVFFQIVLFVILFVIQYPTYDLLFLGGDAGEYINNSYRVSYGDLPYRDFWLLYPPGEVYFPRFLMSIFGFNINFLLLLFIGINAWMGVLVFQIGRLLFNEDTWFVLFLVALIFGNGYARYGSANFIPMHFLFVLLSLKYFIRFLKTKHSFYLFYVGIFIGLAFLFRVFLTGAVFLAFVMVSFYFLKNKRLHVIRHLFGGLLLILIPVIILLHEVVFHGLKEIMIESVAHASNMNLSFWNLLKINTAGIFSDINASLAAGGWQSFPEIGLHLIRLNIILMYFIPFLIPLMTIYFLVKNKISTYQKSIILTFFLIGVFTLPKSLGRSDIQHIYQSSLPFLFLAGYIFYLNCKNNFSKTKVIFPVLKFICVYLLLSNLIIFTKAILSFSTPSYTVHGEFGHFKTTTKERATEANRILKIIAKKTQKGDFIFTTPWESIPFYALAERKNPTYYDSLIDIVARPSEEKQNQICEDILEKKTKLIIHFSSWEFDEKEDLVFDKNCKVLIDCIDEHFEIFEKVGRYNIYQPKKSVIE